MICSISISLENKIDGEINLFEYRVLYPFSFSSS